MATQFASLTPTVHFPAPRQRVRIAYSAQTSRAAIADALTAHPTPVVEATLEELSATDTPLRELVAERNALMAGMNADTSLGDEAGAHTCRRIHAIEQQIIATKARTPDDAVMKLLTLVQIAPNHEIEEDEADNAIAAARQHLGVGYSPTLPDNAPLAMPQGYNPFMRGVWLEWQKAYGRWIDTDRTARAFSDTVHEPAVAAERRFWEKYPRDYDFASDAAAEAERDAVTYPTEWDARDDANWSARHDAMIALYKVPAPGPAELAVKLKVFMAEESYDLIVKEELLNGFLSDARRFGQQGAFVQADRGLLATVEQRTMLERAWPDGEDDVAWLAHSNRVSSTNQKLIDSPAATTEGVLAKLRVAFANCSLMSWAQLALQDPRSDTFREGLRSASPDERIMWSAIDDLARIAGIDLGGPISTPAPSQHAAWLTERNDLLASADRSEAGVSDDEALSRIDRLDSTILGTPATSADDVIAKLVMIAQVQAEGAGSALPELAMLVREAKAHLGMGYVYSAEQAA